MGKKNNFFATLQFMFTCKPIKTTFYIYSESLGCVNISIYLKMWRLLLLRVRISIDIWILISLEYILWLFIKKKYTKKLWNWSTWEFLKGFKGYNNTERISILEAAYPDYYMLSELSIKYNTYEAVTENWQFFNMRVALLFYIHLVG